jgi:hypothetical protein
MLKLKQKQQTVIDLINNPEKTVIVLIGSVETGKTYIAAHAMISTAYSFENAFIPIIRLNKTTAKQTVFRTYLRVLNDMNFIEGIDYTLERNVGEIRLKHSKSVLTLTEADHTKDRDHMKIKGLEPDIQHIDEVDELVESAFDMLESRVGRISTSLVPPKTIVTMNPNNKWAKERFYNAWKEDRLPKNVAVVEFTRFDSWSDQSRYDTLIANRPKAWVERYINNNWDFAEDDQSLFKYRYFDGAIINSLDATQTRYFGYDVAREGTDRSVLALWYGNTLVDIKVVKDKTDQMTTDDQALKLIQYMTQDSVIASNISVDAVGIGVGVIDHLHSKGINVREYKSGAKAFKDDYDNLRSQAIWHFAQGLEKGTIKIYQNCSYQKELIFEALAHNHIIDGKKLSVESKEDIKKRTGSMSPDIFDAVVMGLLPQLNIDPKNDTTRISF